MEKINTDYLKDENEKFRLNFPLFPTFQDPASESTAMFGNKVN